MTMPSPGTPRALRLPGSAGTGAPRHLPLRGPIRWRHVRLGVVVDPFDPVWVDGDVDAPVRDVRGITIDAKQDIPLGHKIALRGVAKGERIFRFGMPAGIATVTIEEGTWVHVHNIASEYLDNEEDHYE